MAAMDNSVELQKLLHLTIWNFCIGLELFNVHKNRLTLHDWSTLPDIQGPKLTVLAQGSLHKVHRLSNQHQQDNIGEEECRWGKLNKYITLKKILSH